MVMTDGGNGNGLRNNTIDLSLQKNKQKQLTQPSIAVLPKGDGHMVSWSGFSVSPVKFFHTKHRKPSYGGKEYI